MNSTQMPVLSVVLPTYNIEQYLRQCLDSVVNQTYTDLEIIIIDDNSTDSTPKIIREYAARDSRIKPVFHRKNAGPGPTRNEGLALATGAYITLMDHDDWQDLDKYAKMMAKANEYNADIVFCNAQEYNQSTGFTNRYYYVPKKPYSGGGLFEIKSMEDFGGLSRMLFPPWAKIVRGELIREHNVRFSADDNKFDDILYHYLSCLFSKRIYFIDEVLYTHRMFPQSISGRTKKNWNMMFDLFKSWDELEEECLKHGVEPRKVFVYYIKTLGNFMYMVKSSTLFVKQMNALIDKYGLAAEDFPKWQRQFYYRARGYSTYRKIGFRVWRPFRKVFKPIRGFWSRNIQKDK